MKVSELKVSGVFLFEPTAFGDARGYFFESWNRKSFLSVQIDPVFVQGNVSGSTRGVLRGLHYQWPTNPQGKLVSVAQGEVFDVAVDVRRGSPQYGRWVGEILSDENRRSLWIPPGFAHGFLVLSDFAIFQYQVTAPYDRAAEVGVRWNDPDIGIEWPISSPVLSEKDAAAPRLAALPEHSVPVMSTCARF